MRASFAAEAPLPESLPARLNARTKLALCVLCSLSSIILSDPLALGGLTLASAAYALSTRNLKGILLTYAAVAAMLGTSAVFVVLLGALWPEIARLEWRFFLVPFLRIVLMINVVLGLALTSRIQSVLTALKSLRLPAVLYIPASVMIRFIPTFIGDARQIHQTLRIRGYPVTPGALLRHPLRSVRVLFVPLVFRALRSADDLAMAAELKGVGARGGITPHRTDPFGPLDAAALLVALGCIAAAFLQQFRAGFGLGMH